MLTKAGINKLLLEVVCDNLGEELVNYIDNEVLAMVERYKETRELRVELKFNMREYYQKENDLRIYLNNLTSDIEVYEDKYVGETVDVVLEFYDAI